jgi:uncharacterized protein YdhG (YjbR/CyaY superfamily)
MKSKAASIDEYLAQLPPERRAAIEVLREVIRKNLPEGYEEVFAVRHHWIRRAAESISCRLSEPEETNRCLTFVSPRKRTT